MKRFVSSREFAGLNKKTQVHMMDFEPRVQAEQASRTANGRPILMRPELVGATIMGLKGETRRAVKDGLLPLPNLCPYGRPGSHLWVREPVRLRAIGDDWFDVVYKTDDIVQFPGKPHKVLTHLHWTPSIHMPRQVCRLELRILKVSAPLLQSITANQARNEGFEYFVKGLDADPKGRIKVTMSKDPIYWFKGLWDEINEAKGMGWDIPQRVWRIQYEVAKCLKK